MADAGRDKLPRYAGDAYRRIIMNSVRENSHESIDRVWSRWTKFCQTEVGYIDLLLYDAPSADVGLLLRAFFERYRRSDFNPDGSIRGGRAMPMITLIIKGAASSLSTSFWSHIERSPLHIQGGNRYIFTLKRLFQAFANLRRQRSLWLQS